MSNLGVIVVICVTSLIISEGRLVEKSTVKTVTDVAVKKTLRIVRGITVSDQDYEQDDPKTDLKDTKYADQTRVARSKKSDKKHKNKTNKNGTTTPSTRQNDSNNKRKEEKRKPVAKFNDVEYYEEFQDSVQKTPYRSQESEEDSFNVDDYDFDFNHDEYTGRGKPMEQRAPKKGQGRPRPEPRQEKEPSPETERKKAGKKHNNAGQERSELRKFKNVKRENYMEKIIKHSDYDYDTSAFTTVKIDKVAKQDDEIEDVYDSVEKTTVKAIVSNEKNKKNETTTKKYGARRKEFEENMYVNI